MILEGLHNELNKVVTKPKYIELSVKNNKSLWESVTLLSIIIPI